MNYELKKIDFKRWNDLLEHSPQGTYFLHTEFLKIFGVKIEFYALFQREKLLVGVPVIDTKNLNRKFLPQCYYQGPVFAGNIFEKSPRKSTHLQVTLIDELLIQLTNHVADFNFCLHPSFTDVRGFSWFNYHQPKKGLCEIAAQYTASIELTNETLISIKSYANKSVRKALRYSQEREQLSFSKSGSFEAFIGLYKETFQRQELVVSQETCELFRSYCNFFKSLGNGHFVSVCNRDNECVATGFMFKDYDNSWQVPFAAMSEARYAGTLLYFGMIEMALADHATKIDFNGANSPQRSKFKHSIGAKPELYFTVSFRSKH